MTPAELARWHRDQAAELKRKSNWRGLSARQGTRDQYAWHLEAAKLAEGLEHTSHVERLAATERDIKIRAVESLEASGKRLIEEAQAVRRMCGEKQGVN